MKYSFFLLFYVSGIFSCVDRQYNRQTIVLDSYVNQASTVFIEKLNPVKGEYEVLDSVCVLPGVLHKVINLSNSSEQLYKLRVKNSLVNFPFIIDKERIEIKFDFIHSKLHSFKNSPKSIAIQNFQQKQQLIDFEINETIKEVSLTSTKNNKLSNYYNRKNENYLKFIDSANDPNIALLFYDHIFFNNDIQQQQNFANKLFLKFPNNKGIQRIKKEVDFFKKVATIEYGIGDTIPHVSLPNEKMKLFNTNNLKGKIVLMQFWNTACISCIPSFNILKNNKRLVENNNLKIVTIALEPDKLAWQNLINNRKEFVNYINLIDTAVWMGRAQEQFFIDSIPFNFLISKDGVIVAKALKPSNILDSLNYYLHKK